MPESCHITICSSSALKSTPSANAPSIPRGQVKNLIVSSKCTFCEVLCEKKVTRFWLHLWVILLLLFPKQLLSVSSNVFLLCPALFLLHVPVSEDWPEAWEGFSSLSRNPAVLLLLLQNHFISLSVSSSFCCRANNLEEESVRTDTMRKGKQRTLWSTQPSCPTMPFSTGGLCCLATPRP